MWITNQVEEKLPIELQRFRGFEVRRDNCTSGMELISIYLQQKC